MGKNWMRQYGSSLGKVVAGSDEGSTASSGTPGAAIGAGSKEFPAAELDPEGKAPEQFIAHHTAGRGTPADIVKDWAAHRPGVGAQYIMDREGNVHDVLKEFGYSGTIGISDKAVPGGMSVRNRNSVQMEIIAKDDKDVTDLQAKRFAEFMKADYPETPVFGHGQVNPGHREATEGQKARLAVEAERASHSRVAQPQPSKPHMGDMSMFQQTRKQNLSIFNKSGANVNVQSAMLGLGPGSFMS
jgi:hypothetical protein